MYSSAPVKSRHSLRPPVSPFKASFKYLEDTAPFLKASSREPYFLTNLSTFIPFSVRVLLIALSKSLVSIPASLTPLTSSSQVDPERTLERKLFLLSAELPIISPNVSDTMVHKFLASSKSPTISSQVFVQPDWAASLRVSINCVNVFTFVAASVAV